MVNGYPLRIEAQQVETREVEFNAGACSARRWGGQPARSLSRCADFLKHIYPKLDWAVLRAAAVSLYAPLLSGCTCSGVCLRTQASLGLEGLPEAVTPELLESDTFLRAFHHVLLEARILCLGCLCWPDTSARCTSRKASWCAPSQDIAFSSSTGYGGHAVCSVCAHAGDLHAICAIAVRGFPTCCSRKTKWQPNRSSCDR